MIDLNKYSSFVLEVMSEQSKDKVSFDESIEKLNEKNINVPMLITSYTGLSGEVGEYSDLIKKVLFQGKEFTEETREQLKSELSDICWYLSAGCSSLGLSLDEIFEHNVNKLMKRYPGGKFDPYYSENREE